MVGFDFERAAVVRVAQHWDASSDPSAQLHQTFLRRLVAALAGEDVFRALIGPPDPRHRTHFHFDMGPWSYRKL